MRTLHCTVALLLSAGIAGAAPGAPPVPPRPAQAAPAGAITANFTVFLRGAPVGTEEVTVTRTDEGVAISGTARLGPPLSLTLRKAVVRYAPDGTAIECTIEGSIRDQLLGVHTVVNGTSATTDATQGMQTVHKTDQVPADTLLLPNVFFGAYEALAARLPGTAPGTELKAYVPPQAVVGIRVGNATEETIRTPAGAVKVRRFSIQIVNPGQPLDAEVWVAPNGRLVRLIVPAQSLDYSRNDIVSVASRREPVSHPGDEQLRLEANGFNLAATLSKPAGGVPKGTRLPAVVLVPAADDTDRDQVVGGVPIYGQLASALADAGFIAVRYDKRGIGQSGGRYENAGLGDYVEDARAVVKALRKRKDVDGKRVAVAGYAEGGLVALSAAERDGDIRALVLLATPGVSGAERVLEQQSRALAKMNMPEAEKQAKIDLQKKINKAAVTGTGWDGVPPAMRKQAETAWFQSYLAFDPAKTMPKVRQPILIVQGSLDHEVLPNNAAKLETLARARKVAQGRTVRLVELPGLNHLFQSAVTGEVDEYAQLSDGAISSKVPDAVAGWLKGVWPKD